MSSTMFIDIQKTLSWEKMKSVFSFSGAELIDEDFQNRRLRAYLPNSEINLFVHEYGDNREITVEDYTGEKWDKGLRISIKDRGILNYKDLVSLLKNITELSPAAFILSYENVHSYVVRSQNQSYYVLTQKSPDWLRESGVQMKK
jgi:hypothetical protein